MFDASVIHKVRLSLTSADNHNHLVVHERHPRFEYQEANETLKEYQ